MTIDAHWLSRPSTEVAPDLIGCTLLRRLPDGTCLAGTIVETEAYGPGDPAMHAYQRPTPRNKVIFGPAGTAYIYLIYGCYHCLNVVTDQDGIASAVLIRALQLASVPAWVDPQREPKPHRIAAGPGKLCRTLQIDRSLNATPLQPGQSLWLEHRSPDWQHRFDQQTFSVTQTTRIGLTKGVDLPWRWYLNHCPAVSRKG
jgi:DNA-3-methyladenine glycosylase